MGKRGEVEPEEAFDPVRDLSEALEEPELGSSVSLGLRCILVV